MIDFANEAGTEPKLQSRGVNHWATIGQLVGMILVGATISRNARA
jgi:hypothetical protein